MEAQIKLDRIFGVQGSHRNLTGAALGLQTEVAETFGREADENGRERRSKEKLVQRLLTSVFVVSLLFAVHGCSVAKRASRS